VYTVPVRHSRWVWANEQCKWDQRDVFCRTRYHHSPFAGQKPELVPESVSGAIRENAEAEVDVVGYDRNALRRTYRLPHAGRESCPTRAKGEEVGDVSDDDYVDVCVWTRARVRRLADGRQRGGN
jgi:hypothetical protein